MRRSRLSRLLLLFLPLAVLVACGGSSTIAFEGSAPETPTGEVVDAGGLGDDGAAGTPSQTATDAASPEASATPLATVASTPIERPSPTPTADPFEGGPAWVSDLDQTAVLALVSETEDATFRGELFFTMRMVGDGVAINIASDLPMVTTAQAGEDTSSLVDVGVIYRGIFESFGAGAGSPPPELEALLTADLSTETRFVDGIGYLRAPFLAALGGLTGGFASMPAEIRGVFETLVSLGDGWARFDPSAVPDFSAGQLSQAAGGFGSSGAAEMFTLLRTTGAVTLVGPADVRGVATDRYAGEVSLADLLEASGVDPAMLEGLTADGPLDAAAFAAFTIPFSFYVDESGRLRRVDYELSLADLVAGAAAEIPADLEFTVGSRLELFDYDDPSITIEAPPVEDIVTDLTDELIGLMGAF